MKRNQIRRYFLTTTILFLCLIGCQPDDDLHVPNDLRINDFVWKGMNLYYLWQQEVPDLDDERFSDQQDLNTFLSSYDNPAALFHHLRVDPQTDRFSVIYDDYRVLEGILSGTTKNNGVDYQLNLVEGATTEVFGWVRYILPDSDAATKNIHRGDIFHAVNGIPLTVENYRSLLAADTYTLNLADYDNGVLTPNGESVSLTKSVYSENPVYSSAVIDAENNKIGYLMYNGFYPQYESQLNQAFGSLKVQNITHLVLDLRYNSGGSIATATKLASMITGQFTGQVFAKEQWNSKMHPHYEQVNPQNLVNRFTASIGNAPINDLQLTTVYVLTSASTASASELVINGLKPYIDVVQIGDYTTGKNVGSVTLYDSPSFGKRDRNPNHFYAMQPIVLKVVNKDGFGDYQQNGLAPDVFLPENLSDLGVLGTLTDPLFSTAVAHITANNRLLHQRPAQLQRRLTDKKEMMQQNQMYRSMR